MSFELAVVCGIFAASGLFALLSFKTTKEHTPLRLLFLFVCLLFAYAGVFSLMVFSHASGEFLVENATVINYYDNNTILQNYTTTYEYSIQNKTAYTEMEGLFGVLMSVAQSVILILLFYTIIMLMVSVLELLKKSHKR